MRRATILTTTEALLNNPDEFEAAARYFDVTTSRCSCRRTLVIPRYSALPHYVDLVLDLEFNCNEYPSSPDAFRWIADFGYYDQLKEFTFQTWTPDDFYRCTHPGPFVVKGRTNSKKYNWDTHMFARTKQDAVRIGCMLSEDSLLASQSILYRKYEPLVTHEVGLNGLPFTNEYRLFYDQGEYLAGGFYWSESDRADSRGEVPAEAREFADQVAAVAKCHAHSFVIDVAEKAAGGWIMVEMNTFEQSGLSCIDPDAFYSALAKNC